MNITFNIHLLEDNDTDFSYKGITEIGQRCRREDEEKGKNKQRDEQLNNLLCSSTVSNFKFQLSYPRLLRLNGISMGTESPLHPGTTAGSDLPL